MQDPQCAKCQPKYCYYGKKDEKILPEFCPMKNFKDLIRSTSEKYKTQELHDFFIQAAVTEKEAYDEKYAREKGKTFPIRPRIREVAEFAKKIGAGKLGIAFCIGLADEAERATEIFENHGLKICSAVCSCGAIDKTELGILPEQKIRDPENFESSCNPLLQAEIFNSIKTDFNIIIGLCIGHDMLFTKYSKAPVTTLIVKDRFSGHNPVISLYSRYYKDIV
jgi:uncharacterized metal-binding protein